MRAVILFILLVGYSAAEQTTPGTGQTMRQVLGDKVVRQIQKREDQAGQARVQGFTVQEVQEFKKLHDADATLLHQIVQGRVEDLSRYKALEAFVETIPEVINTRIVTQTADDVKGLLDREKKREEKTQAIWNGVILLLIGGLLKAVWEVLKLKIFDPNRRDAARLKIDQAADLRIADVVGRIETVKEVVEHTHHEVAAVCGADHVGEKISTMAKDVEEVKDRIKGWSGQQA